MLEEVKREEFVKLVDSGKLQPVPYGYEGRYFVSAEGAIYTDRGDQVMKLSPTQDTKGVWNIPLGTEMGFRSYDVADIVLDSFQSGKPEDGKAMYLDGDTDNYALSNLTWVTNKEFKLQIVKCRSSSIERKELETRNNKKIEIPSEPYIRKFKMNSDHFDMLIGALEPIYNVIKHIDCLSNDPNAPVFMLNSGESSAISYRDGQRIKDFFQSLTKLENRSDSNEKNI